MITEMLLGALIAFLTMFITWLYYLKVKNPGVVDVSWGIGIFLVGQWYLWDALTTPKALLASLLLLMWAIRLSGHLWYTRVRPKHIEKRYVDIAKGWKVKQELGFLANYILQAFLLYWVATPFLFLTATSTFHVIDLLAVALVVIGIGGEAIADYQLYRYKQAKKGNLCNEGLWYYSRHPNYFFDLGLRSM